MKPFKIIHPTIDPIPIVISIPHCGTLFPEGIRENYMDERLADLDDTDWFLQDLNEFAASMGITVVHAVYHRWVIDLNRDPSNQPLYNDGRIITGLTSLTDFFGNSLYKKGYEPDTKEIDRRLEAYFWPYYQAIQEVLDERIAQFGKVLLWDEHSIRSFVPTIRPTVFPEMILGDNDEKSADQELIQTTLKNLNTRYKVNHNDPFKGGHITRYFGNPSNGVHALQLERNKNLYMDDSERVYDEQRANSMIDVLKKNFMDLNKVLIDL